MTSQVRVRRLHRLSAHPSAFVGDGLGVATGRLGESGGPRVPEGMWLDEPQPCASAGSLDHLTGTVGAEGFTGSFADKLDEDEIGLGKRSYAVVVLGEILVVAGNHCRACPANGPSRDDSVDDRRWQSSLRTRPVRVEALHHVGVRPFTLAARM